MKTRIISGLCMVPLILVLIFRGIPLAIVAFLIGLIGVMELIRGFSKIGIKANVPITIFSILLLYGLHFAFIILGVKNGEVSPATGTTYITFWLVLSIMASFISGFKLDRNKIEDGLATVIGIVYVIFFSYHIVMIDQTGWGILVWMVAITAFCTDIFAYFTGYFIGKTKLAPVLSPKKTVEGAIGGIIGTVLCSIIFGLIAKVEIFPHLIIMGILGSIFGQLGDLTASAFKRRMGLKDFGNIIPGHGGILDRFDSILFTAPAIYYYIMLVIPK